MTGEIWTISEHKIMYWKEVSFELLCLGRKLADERQTALCAVVFASNITEKEMGRLFEHGADKCMSCRMIFLPFPSWTSGPHFEISGRSLPTRDHPAGATTSGRTLMPYVAMQVIPAWQRIVPDWNLNRKPGNLLQIPAGDWWEHHGNHQDTESSSSDGHCSSEVNRYSRCRSRTHRRSCAAWSSKRNFASRVCFEKAVTDGRGAQLWKRQTLLILVDRVCRVRKVLPW